MAPRVLLSSANRQRQQNVLPFVSITPELVTAKKGAEVRFECKANGTPVPQISWTHDGEPLNLLNDRILSNRNRSVITFTEIQVKDSGITFSDTCIEYYR